MNLAGRRRSAALLLASATLTACSGSTPSGFTSTLATVNGRLELAPLAVGTPLPLGTISAPHQTREQPTGPMAFIIDSGYSSVYEFDLGRRRFIGPAPRLLTDRLPGYPTVLGHFAPQKAIVIGRTLYIADGGGSAISAIPINRDGLGEPVKINLPTFGIRLRPSEGGRSAMSGPVFVDRITLLPDGRLLALGEDKVNGIGLAYAIDPNTQLVTGTLELPVDYGWAQGATNSGGTTVLAMDQDRLLLMQDNPLSISRVLTLPGLPLGGALILGGSAVVPVDSPPRLVMVDLESGSSKVIDQAAGGLSGGGVVTDGTRLWWALKSGKVREVTVQGNGRPAVSTFSVCDQPAALAYVRGTVLAVCMDQRLALVDLAKRQTWFTPSGSFPFAVVVSAQ